MLIYTDGSVRDGVGGWAWVEVSPEKEILRGRSGRITEAVSSNRMELLAVIQALLSTDDGSEVLIRTDSQYVINICVHGHLDFWRQYGWVTAKNKPVSNRDLWEVIIPLLERRRVQFEWVKGHADDPFNELCDRLANADKYRETLPIVSEPAPFFPEGEEPEGISTIISPTVVFDPAFPEGDSTVLPVGLPTQALVVLSKEDYERLNTFIRAFSIADPTWKTTLQSLKSVVYV